MRSTLVVVAFGLAACNPLHTARKVDDVKLADTRQPSGWTQPVGAAAAPDRWWQSFDDPALDAMITRLLTDNLDLAQAWSRLAQSQAVAAQQGAARMPTLDVQGSAAANQIWSPTTDIGAGANGVPTVSVGPNESSTVETYGLSLAASYEIDLFDRLGAATRAARMDVEASRLDLEAVAVTLTAQAADLWYALVEARATEALLETQIATNETQLELVRFRFSNGLISATDVLQQQQLVISTRRQLPGVQARRATLEHQLAILLGRPPADGTQLAGDGARLPDPPALPAAGLPSALLTRRPDIRAAQIRVAAADERVGAALAGRLPSLRLSASVGFSANSLGDLIDQWVWSVAGSLLAPIFDAGRRSAEVDRSRAAVEGALAGFNLAALRAFGEVEDALVLEARQAETIERLEAELEVATRLLEQARSRYEEGLTDYLPVLGARQGQQRAELSLLSARRQRLSYRIQLHRALGGTWTRDLAPVARREGESS